MSARLELQVYPTDAEAFEAAAALATERLRPATGPVRVALPGGRSGRGVLVALAARGDLPCERIDWFLGDERCVPADDPHGNLRLAHDSLFNPRAVPAARVHAPPVDLAEPAEVAAAYAATLEARLGSALSFDLVLLALGGDGAVAALVPGGAALASTAAAAVVLPAELSDEPRVARITVTPRVLHAARAVVVVAVGDLTAAAVAAAMREPHDPTRHPAHLVRPDARVTWIIDRAAAAILLRDAR